jgi:hypothetical protein
MLEAKNTVTVGSYNFVVTGKNKPFSNDFIQQSAKVVQYDGVNELACVVLCTENSKEPGRRYFVQYNTKGVLMECRTLN